MPSKDVLVSELKGLQARYNAEGNAGPIARGYWRKATGRTDADFERHFGTWKNFLSEALDTIDPLVDAEKEAAKLSVENRRLKADKARLLSALNTRDDFAAHLRAALADRYKPTKPTKPRPQGGPTTYLILSDWHVGQYIRPETVSDLEAYDLATCRERVLSIIGKARDILATITPSRFTVVLLGDLIDGAIHAEQMRNWEFGPTEAIIKTSDLLVDVLRAMCPDEVLAMVGNHGRMYQGKPYYADAVVGNYETLLFHALRGALPSIPFTIPAATLHVTDHILFTHGDTLTAGTGGFPGIPLNSLTQSAVKLRGTLGQFRHVVAGHLHRDGRIPLPDGGSLILNGSVVGVTPFGLSKIKTPASVSQALIITREGQIVADLALRP
jgi:hypothetical protein